MDTAFNHGVFSRDIEIVAGCSYIGIMRSPRSVLSALVTAGFLLCMSIAAAFGCTMGIVRSTLDFDLMRFISNPPGDTAEGLGCAIRQIPKRDRRDGVTTLKYATAHGPGFLTGSLATKIISAAPFRAQSSGNAFLSHRERVALRSVF